MTQGCQPGDQPTEGIGFFVVKWGGSDQLVNRSGTDPFGQLVEQGVRQVVQERRVDDGLRDCTGGGIRL